MLFLTNWSPAACIILKRNISVFMKELFHGGNKAFIYSNYPAWIVFLIFKSWIVNIRFFVIIAGCYYFYYSCFCFGYVLYYNYLFIHFSELYNLEYFLLISWLTILISCLAANFEYEFWKQDYFIKSIRFIDKNSFYMLSNLFILSYINSYFC